MKRVLSVALLSLLALAPAQAQTVTNPAVAAMVCANNTVVPTPVAGQFFYVQCDSTGKLITSSTGGGLTPGTTVITGGTNTRVLFDDNGVLGESAGLTYIKASGLLNSTAMAIGGATIGPNALAVTGTANISGALTLGAGSAPAPSINFSDAGTGFYRFSANQIGTVFGGTLGIIYEGATLGQVFASGYGLGYSSNGTVAGLSGTLTRASANTLQVGSNGANALGSLNLTNLTPTGTIDLTTAAIIKYGSVRAYSNGGGVLTFDSGSTSNVINLLPSSGIVTLTSAGTATLQLGAADVSSGAVAQTLKAQSNTGNSTTGPNLTIQAANGGASGGTGGDLILTPGTGGSANGNVRFGVVAANVAVTPAGTIAIRDAGGTLRYLIYTNTP